MIFEIAENSRFLVLFLQVYICCISPLYVTSYTKTNHMQKTFFFFNGFRNIFAASIVVANLKGISCSLTELRLLFMPFFE